MICERVIGSLKEEKYHSYEIDYVDIEWFEAFKRRYKKITRNGQEIGILLGNDILKRGLRQGDVLYETDGFAVAANILPCEALIVTVDKDHFHMIAKVCYEIGNKHATLFRGDDEFEFITPYHEPIKLLLEKLHGVKIRKEMVALQFEKSISSSINNHTH